MLVIGHGGSCGGLNSRLIQTKNRSLCENAVTGIWGSCTLLMMGSCQYQIVVRVILNVQLIGAQRELKTAGEKN